MPTLEKINIMETPDTNATKMNFVQGSSNEQITLINLIVIFINKHS